MAIKVGSENYFGFRSHKNDLAFVRVRLFVCVCVPLAGSCANIDCLCTGLCVPWYFCSKTLANCRKCQQIMTDFLVYGGGGRGKHAKNDFFLLWKEKLA